MIYAYLVANTDNEHYRDNSPIFKAINDYELKDEQIYVDELPSIDNYRQLLLTVSSEDIILVRSLADLADRPITLLKILLALGERGVSIESCLEPTYEYNSFLKFYHDYIESYKTTKRKKGYDKALKQGKVGRPKNPEVLKAMELYNKKTYTTEQISKITGVSQSTLYRALKEIDNQS